MDNLIAKFFKKNKLKLVNLEYEKGKYKIYWVIGEIRNEKYPVDKKK